MMNHNSNIVDDFMTELDLPYYIPSQNNNKTLTTVFLNNFDVRTHTKSYDAKASYLQILYLLNPYISSNHTEKIENGKYVKFKR